MAIAGVCMVTALGHLMLFKAAFVAISIDEYARAHAANSWRLHKAALDKLVSTWLPFHTVAVGLALDAWPDLIVAPRVLTMLFGIALVVTIAVLALHLFHSQTVAIAAALLVACYPDRVVLAAVGLAEVMFQELIGLALIFLLHYFRGRQTGQLVAAGLFLALSSTVRYEGWVFAAVAGLLVLVLWHRGQVTSGALVLFGAIVMAFPLTWMTLHGLLFGTPLGMWQVVEGRYELIRGASTPKRILDNVAVQFMIGNLRTFNLIGILAVVGAVMKDRAARLVMVIAGGALIIMSALGLTGKALPSHNFWRVASVWGLLLVPFTAHLAVQLGERVGRDWTWLSPRVARKVGVAAAVGVFAASFLFVTLQTVQWTHRPKDALRAGKELVRLLDRDRDRKVLIETADDWEFVEAPAALRGPGRLLLDAGWDPRHPSAPVLDPDNPSTVSKLRQAGIGWLVFKSPRQQVWIESAGLGEVEAVFGEWRIYRVPAAPRSDPGSSTRVRILP